MSPAADFHEGDRVGFEEEVEDAVDEGEVDGDEEEDGFQEEHLEGTEEVFRSDVSPARPVLVQEGVVSPVFGLKAETGCTSLEQDGGIGLWDDQKGDCAEECGCDQGDP